MKILNFDSLFKTTILGKETITVDVKLQLTRCELTQIYLSYREESEVHIEEVKEGSGDD